MLVQHQTHYCGHIIASACPGIGAPLPHDLEACPMCRARPYVAGIHPSHGQVGDGVHWALPFQPGYSSPAAPATVWRDGVKILVRSYTHVGYAADMGPESRLPLLRGEWAPPPPEIRWQD